MKHFLLLHDQTTRITIKRNQFGWKLKWPFFKLFTVTFTWAYYICIVSQFIIPAYRWVMMMLTKSFLWLSCLKSIRNSVIIHFIAKEVRVKATKTLNVILAQQKGIPLQGEKTTRVSEQYWFVCFASSYTYGKYEQDRSLDIIPWEKKEIRTAHYYKLSCSSCDTKTIVTLYNENALKHLG